MQVRDCNMKAVQCGLLVFFCIRNKLALWAFADSGCTSPNVTSTHNVTPAVVAQYPFRRDLLTVRECITYDNLEAEDAICALIPHSDYCIINDETPRRLMMLNTYVEIACLYKPRSLVIKTIKRVREISPRRAVVLDLFEFPLKENLITVTVVEPIRNHTIGLTVTGCYAPNTTSRIHTLGTIPNLHSLAIYSCRHLDIQKSDFSRLPQLRQIVFDLSSIDTLEPDTFTDLPHLRTLVLEKNLILAFFSPKNRSQAYYSVVTGYLDYLQKLHCDCSSAWLRSFLKQKRYLIEEKEPGEVFRIGSYFSEAVKRTGNRTDVFSVDCSKNLTLENISTGNEFSYNVSCPDDYR
ncbi:uncharacterized protein LOC129602158 [Paramacrobiotus metropolitanus]|uniref:uncharacterized protein LOC129602158 n=1 Tax=Paramacrobiotus metropolitanus TaxID=2943436 RepID=UPI0024462BE5|nr:uncharacterized protein LOC129602158 [Paramacrobiotus metropolitanus]